MGSGHLRLPSAALRMLFGDKLAALIFLCVRNRRHCRVVASLCHCVVCRTSVSCFVWVVCQSDCWSATGNLLCVMIISCHCVATTVILVVLVFYEVSTQRLQDCHQCWSVSIATVMAVGDSFTTPSVPDHVSCIQFSNNWWQDFFVPEISFLSHWISLCDCDFTIFVTAGTS